MKIALIFSKDNMASMNIYNNLNVYMKKYAQIHVFEENQLSLDNLDDKIKADLFIFPCTHKSKLNVPSLTIHPIGNFDKADFGGKEKTLVKVDPSYLSFMFKELFRQSNEKYEVTLEATHHGPYLNKPSFFIEIGSTEKEWNNKGLGKIISKTIYETLKNKVIPGKKAFGLGGNHYAKTFNKIILRTDMQIGHICPKHFLSILDEDLILQLKEKSNADFAVLDWKGLGKFKQETIKLLESLNIKYKRSDHLLK